MLLEIFRLLGTGDDFASKLKGWMINAGLVDVQDRELVVHMGDNATDSDPVQFKVSLTDRQVSTVLGSSSLAF